MKINDIITELLDPETAFPLKWDKQFAGHGEFHASATDADGREIGISFTPMDVESNATDVAFTRGGTHEMTGKGDAARVMATVIKAIQIFGRTILWNKQQQLICSNSCYGSKLFIF